MRHVIKCPSQIGKRGMAAKGLSTMTMMRAIQGPSGGCSSSSSSSANFPPLPLPPRAPMAPTSSLPSSANFPTLLLRSVQMSPSSRYGAIMTTIDRDQFIDISREPSTEKPPATRIRKVNLPATSTKTSIGRSSLPKFQPRPRGIISKLKPMILPGRDCSSLMSSKQVSSSSSTMVRACTTLTCTSIESMDQSSLSGIAAAIFPEIDQNNNQVSTAHRDPVVVVTVPDADNDCRIIEEVDLTEDGKESVTYVEEKKAKGVVDKPHPDEPVIEKFVRFVDLIKDATGVSAGVPKDPETLPVLDFDFDGIIDNCGQIKTEASAVEYLDNALDFVVEHEAAIYDFLAGKWMPGMENGSIINININLGHQPPQ